ncbi:MAG: YIP1 family protein [Pyrinomonadaceae bacterium]|nr:YIP1 family protein [Acidobacteriota bacterium]MBP7375385.1 YIP1 family protein [Pyrinomonadaceae bacterium]
MSEENTSGSQAPPPEWQTPPPPEKITATDGETAQMSEIGTIANIFIEPGNTFEDLRRKPRFILGGLLLVLLFSVFQIAFVEKIGLETIVRSRIESSSRTSDLSKEAKDTIVQQQAGPIAKYITYGATPIVMIIVFLIGGLLYWLGANAMGGSATFLRGLAVWIYSSIPATLLFTLTNLLVLFLKNPDDIDIGRSQQGLIQANPGFFLDAKAQPVLTALVSSLDLFAIIGWVFAAIGLQKIGKISSGAAWAIVLILALVGVTFKVVAALVF